MKKVFQFAAVALVAVMVSCSGGNGPEGSAKGYLDAFYSDDFDKAKEFSTEETKGFLDLMKSFQPMLKAASDSTGGENKEATKKEYNDLKCKVDAGDSTAVCEYKIEDKDEKINLKKVGDKWLVHMPKDGGPFGGGMEGGMMDGGAEMSSDTAAPAATEAPAAETK